MLKKRGKRLKKNSNNDPMLIKQIIIRKKAQEIEKKSPYILLFHYSGLTSRQW
jgi:ribosomal protein L10